MLSTEKVNAESAGAAWEETIAWRRVSQVQVARNRHEDALAALNKALTLARGLGDRQQEAGILSAMGQSWQHLSHLEDAYRVYEKAIEVNPSYAPAHRNLGVVLDLFINDSVTAQSEFETYKTLTGEDKPVTGWIAELKARNRAGAPREPAPEAAEAAPPAQGD